MKKSLFLFAIVLTCITISSRTVYSANELFRSIVSGNWNSTSTWEMSTNGGGAWVPATITPDETSGAITIQNPNTVTVTVNINADELTVNGGGTISVNNLIILTILDGPGTDLTAVSGGSVIGSGTLRTQGASVLLSIRSGSNLSVALKINSGTTAAYDPVGPFTAFIYGTITVDAGATLTVVGGGYTIQAFNTITNNGTISAGGGSVFLVKGPTLVNSGTIDAVTLNFEDTTSISGAGTFSSSVINIVSLANVSLDGNVTFSPGSFTIQSGGTLNPNSKIFTQNSGTFTCNSGGNVTNSGTFRTQGTVSLCPRAGSNFNGSLKVNTGTTTGFDPGGPFIGYFNGSIIVDAGATFNVLSNSYFVQATGNVTNNGTITSGSGSTFIMRGSSLINNGVINPNFLNFDSTTSVSGSGTFSSANININSTGNVSLGGAVAFSPTPNFNINNGGILNPNTRTFTLNAGVCTINNGGNVSNSGVFRTQNSVSLLPRAGSNFICPLRINTGTTTVYDPGNPFIGFINGNIIVDGGATLTVQGGSYSARANGNVTNNGTITSGSGSSFIMRGSVLTNNGVINPVNLNFDSTTSIVSTGSFTSPNININATGNVSLGSNVTFSPAPNFTINNGGILNPNSKTFTLSSGTGTINNGGTVLNSGTFRTQNTVTLQPRAGSNFNCALKVNTGTTTSYDSGNPFAAFFNGTIVVDAGATLAVQGGGYFINAYNDVTNNGTIGGASTFRFFGANLTNNGLITGTTFNFDTGAHNLQGVGSWNTTGNVLNGSTVTLTSNHQMHSVAINSGGTFNLSAFKLLLIASNPINNSGTFNTAGGTVEYNGSSAQIVSTTNITYSKLRINNSSGTSLFGNVTVTDTLSDVLGHLNLNGQILTISPTGYLAETPNNTVNGSAGYITTTRDLNAPSSMNVGGLGAVISTAVNLGSTEIRRGHTIQNGLAGNTSIERYFDIMPTNNAGLNGTLVYMFDESELNNKVESGLLLYRSTNSGIAWTLQGGSVNTSANSITLSGINAFSRWSATSTGAVFSQIKVIEEGFYNLATGRLNMRDTVRAYLRQITNPFNVVDSAKSVIDSVTFTGSFLFANAPSGTYYIQIKHRNSIETWSRSGGEPYTLGISLFYDFTDNITKAYDNNMIQKGSKFCIYSGDINQNGSVDGQDLSIADNEAFNFSTGYVSADVNGNRVVDAEDLSIVDNNAFNFVTRKIPQ